MGQNCSFCNNELSEEKAKASSSQFQSKERKPKDQNRAQQSCEEYSNRIMLPFNQAKWPKTHLNETLTESGSYMEVTSPPTFGPEGRNKFLLVKDMDKDL